MHGIYDIFVHATLWKGMGPICIYDKMNATCDCTVHCYKTSFPIKTFSSKKKKKKKAGVKYFYNMPFFVRLKNPLLNLY